MNDDRTALEVFRGACELPREERGAFLDAACGTDRDLRAQVESMLAWDGLEEAADREGEPPGPVRAALADLAQEAESGQVAAEGVPETIGGYRIVRLIARGGMGVVYEGWQEHPARRVAVKVAHASGTGSDLARRFELETQLLARLRHPGIAQIIEAGATSSREGAQPFFVMELVTGRPLVQYADAHLAGARQRLELMVRVCDAVAFAHARGVTHRDLKPDNVLVEPDGTPKVLDFGVAKVQEASGFGAATLRTVAGRIIGTLGYMAPEQLAGQTESIGPAADVYSLGAMIYQLLTGRLPHDLEGATFTRALAIVTTTDAPPLSVVRPEYRGDIEALVAHALEKDPRQRYPDAAALQADLGRHLRGEPIRARPAGTLRRVSKWGRRNPALATAVFGLFFALAAAAAVLLVKNREVRRTLAEFELLADSKRLERAVSQADELWPAREDRADAIETWLHEYGPLTEAGLVRQRRQVLADLRERAVASDGVRWTFDDDLLQLEHDVLAQLVVDLERFAADTGLFQRVRTRLELARRIGEITVADRRADWDAAIARIRTNPRYEGLELEPQVGLVPLGPDPDSGLEEFLHYETHHGDIPPAGLGAERTLGFEGSSPWPETGLILVLIPGGTYWMGAQKDDETERNYDPNATFRDARVHEERVEPFFLSKYEMTQSQWERCVGTNPSDSKGPVKPVTFVSWIACDRAVRQIGLTLPSDVQWEYAARGGPGDKPIWWTGDDVASLRGKENLFDRTTARRYPEWSVLAGEPAPWEDGKKRQRFEAGNFGPAPPGTYAANPFGLYDVGGNVTEWCSNGPGKGGPTGRFGRGGNYRRPPVWARSTARNLASIEFENEELGLRPAMAIRTGRAR